MDERVTTAAITGEHMDGRRDIVTHEPILDQRSREQDEGRRVTARIGNDLSLRDLRSLVCLKLRQPVNPLVCSALRRARIDQSRFCPSYPTRQLSCLLLEQTHHRTL